MPDLIIGMNTLGLLLSVVTIIAKVPYQTDSHDDVFLCAPACVKMTRLGHRIYQGELSLPPGQTTRTYRINRGSTQSEVSNGQQTLSITSPNPTVLQLFQWNDRPATGASPMLQVIPNFYSPELNNSRALRILLPKSYAAHPERHYPVIYMHDGQNLFDSATANYKIEWNVDETLLKLADQGKVQEAIVVAPDANADRLNEYDYTIKGERYANFLMNTVKPYVDQHYRTLTDREHTYLSGSSMGAHLSLSLLWNHPEVFSKMAGLSFPAAIHDKSIYKVITLDHKPTLNIDIYLDHGDYAGDADYPKPADDFIDYLKNKLGFTHGKLVYLNFPFAEHFEADWARRFAVPLQFLLGKP